MTEKVSYHRFSRIYFSVFSLVLVSIEKIYQTLKKLFNHITKHFEVGQIYFSTLRVLFSILFSVFGNVVKLLHEKLLAPVVQRLDNAIHRINHYPADSMVCFVNIYPLDSDLSCG